MTDPSPEQVGAAVGGGHYGRGLLQQREGVRVGQRRRGRRRRKILGRWTFYVILYVLWEKAPPVAVGGLCGIPRLVVSLVAPGEKPEENGNVKKNF